MLETTIASALLTLFLSSLFALNSTVLRLLRSAYETAGASQELQTRVEQVRMATWVQVSQSGTLTSARGAMRNLLAVRTDALGDLPGAKERIEAIRYEEPLRFDGRGNVALPAATFAVERNESGAITVRDSNNALTTSNLTLFSEEKFFVRVIVTWTGWRGQTRSRELVTLVSRWGINK